MNGSGALAFYKRLIVEYENHGASSCVRRRYCTCVSTMTGASNRVQTHSTQHDYTQHY